MSRIIILFTMQLDPIQDNSELRRSKIQSLYGPDNSELGLFLFLSLRKPFIKDTERFRVPMRKYIRKGND